MQLFMEYDWPGNVRELENLIKRTVVLGTEAPIRKEISQRHRARRRTAPSPRAAVRPPRSTASRGGRRARLTAAAPASCRRRPIADRRRRGRGTATTR